MNPFIPNSALLNDKPSRFLKPSRFTQRISGVMVLLSMSLVLAEPLQEAMQTQLEIQEAASATQQQVVQLDDERQQMLQEYQQIMQRTAQLQAHHNKGQQRLNKQRAEQQQLQQQIADLDNTRTELMPLLEQMFTVLENFVRLDLPFLSQERQQRLQVLRELIDDPSLSLADKYQRVWQAYQVEMSYGHGLETYTASLDDGTLVNFFRLGRLALYYLSLDGKQAALWNPQTQNWQALPLQYHTELKTAIRIAKGQATPRLLNLPLKFSPKRP